MTRTHTHTSHGCVSGYTPSSISPPSLTCGLVFYANQYSGEDSYDDDEDHHGNSHHHPNDDSSLHTTGAWSVWRRWKRRRRRGRRGRRWRKRYIIDKARLLQVLSSANTKHEHFNTYYNTTDSCTQSAMNLVW